MTAKRLALLLIAAPPVLLLSCAKDSTSGPSSIASIQVTPGVDTLVSLGQTRQMTAGARDAAGNAISGVTFTWRSTLPTVARVDSITGLVTAVANGAASIQAVASGITGQASLAVAQRVASITVSPDTAVLNSIGATQQLSAAARDGNGNVITGTTFVWRSTNTSVARVDSTMGLVTAIANGAAAIQAVAGSVTAQAAFSVAQVVATVTVTPGSVTQKSIGAHQTFGAVAKDSNGNTIAGIKFLWVSADPTVATVDSTGTTTSRGPGQTTITAAGRGVPGNAALTVTQVPTQLVMTVAPASTTAGSPFSKAVEIEVRDSAGSLVTGSRAAVTLSLGTNPGGDVLHGTTTVNAIGGVASFSGLWLEKAAAGYTIAASATGVSAGATSAAFSISAGPIAGLAFLTQPVATGANAPINVQVGVVDRYGNTVSSVPATAITVALGANPGNGVLSGTKTVVTSAGIATFADLAIDSLASGYALSASALPGNAVSQPFNVLLSFNQLSAGYLHTCGITSNGKLYCWGYNSAGQLGDGTRTNRPSPTLVSGGHTFTKVVAGYDNTCALTAAGAAYCWGSDRFGQLGINSANDSSFTPVAVQGGLTFRRTTRASPRSRCKGA